MFRYKMILANEQDIHANRTNENEAPNVQQQSVRANTPNRSPYYNVKENCALASFLREHQVSLPVQLNVILTVLKEYILSRACFDPSNSSIILCSQLLENIFGMKSLHVIQVSPPPFLSAFQFFLITFLLCFGYGFDFYNYVQLSFKREYEKCIFFVKQHFFLNDL